MIEKHGISIIIPCYNSGRYLRETVASVFAQGCTIPFEIILVDDGSTDNGYTVGVIKSLSRDHPGHIRAGFIPENSGQSTARNTAIAMAQYRYILPLDSDDRLATAPGLTGAMSYMARACTMMDQNPDLVMVYARAEFFEGHRGPWVLPPYNERMILLHNMVPCYAVCRRDDVVRAGGYNPAMRAFEDWDLSIALINNRYRAGLPAEVHRFDEPYYQYRIRRTADNVSQQQVSPADILSAAFRRSPEIYRRHFNLSPQQSEKSAIDILLQHHTIMAKDYKRIVLLESLTFTGIQMAIAHRASRVGQHISRRLAAIVDPVLSFVRS